MPGSAGLGKNALRPAQRGWGSGRDKNHSEPRGRTTSNSPTNLLGDLGKLFSFSWWLCMCLAYPSSASLLLEDELSGLSWTPTPSLRKL